MVGCFSVPFSFSFSPLSYAQWWPLAINLNYYFYSYIGNPTLEWDPFLLAMHIPILFALIIVND